MPRSVGARFAFTEHLGLELSASYGVPVAHRYVKGDYFMLMSALSYQNQPDPISNEVGVPGILSVETGVGVDVRDGDVAGRIALGLRASDRFTAQTIVRTALLPARNRYWMTELGIGLRTRFLATERGAPHVDIEIAFSTARF